MFPFLFSVLELGGGAFAGMLVFLLFCLPFGPSPKSEASSDKPSAWCLQSLLTASSAYFTRAAALEKICSRSLAA